MRSKAIILSSLLLALVLPAVSEACQQYRDTVQDRNGNVLAGVSITISRSGNSVPTTIYTDPACTTVSANPITSGTTGEFIFYAPDGQYDIRFSKNGYTFLPLTNLSVYQPLGENNVTNGTFSTDDVCATGVGAIDLIGSNVRELVINRPATCSQTKTAPSTLSWRFEGNGSVTTTSPTILTINGPVKAVHGRTVWAGSGTYVFGSSSGPTPYGQLGIVEPTLGGPSVVIDASLGKTFSLVITNSSAFTIAAPTKGSAGQEIRITIKNTSGGALGTATWNSAYKLGAAWTQPANGFSRTVTFLSDGTNWIEVARTANDVSN